MGKDLDIFKIKTNNIAPQKGRILIAEPFLSGNYFNRSVVLLVAHSDKGAVGFILNKRVDFPIHEIFPDFPEFEAKVYLGGPVATDSIYFIHKLGKQLPGSIQVLGGRFRGVKKADSNRVTETIRHSIFLRLFRLGFRTTGARD